MELFQLEQFMAIVENKTMVKAAKQLHISQPALSAGLKKLETELGTQLFDREKNKMVLNKAGEIVYHSATDIMNSVSHMKISIQDYISNNSSVHIGFDDPGPMWYIMPQLFMAYGNDSIKNELFEQANIESILLNKKYNILICSYDIVHPQIISKKLIEETMYLSVPSDSIYTKYHKIDILDNPPSSLIHYVCQGERQVLLNKFWKELNQKTNLKIYTDYFMFNQAIRNENHITFTTKLVKNYRDDGPNRKLIPIINKESKSSYYIAYLKDNQNILKDYIQFITYIFNKADE